jgi:hypothetical protein
MNAPATAANPFGSSAIAERQSDALVAVEQTRAIAETQAAMAIAKKFPRDPVLAMDRILNACTRPTLAEQALYTYARGGTEITGPSIRLAEGLAQNWGNLSFGIRELEQRAGESTVETFCWDIETNTKQVKTFQVKHERFTKKGSYALTDPRDIYELTANQGARRLRACILGIIPGDVVEAAVKQCEVTLKSKAEVTPERLKSLVEKFTEYQITTAQIEARIQRHLDAMTPGQMVSLGKIYNSLKDGMSTPGDWFEVSPSAADTQAKPATGADALKAAVAKAKATPPTTAQGGAPGVDDDPTLGMPGAGDISHVGGTANGAAAVDYEKLLAEIKGSADLDTIDNHATLIGQVDGADRQNALAKAYKLRRGELQEPKAKK